MSRSRHETAPNIEQKYGHIEQIVKDQPEIVGLQAYEYFRNNNASEKSAFLNGDIRNPRLTYPALTDELIHRLAGPTESALRMLARGERDKKVDALYTAIEYRFAEMHLLAVARRMHDETKSEKDREEAAAFFNEVNEALYGSPEPEVFSALANPQLFDRIEKQLPEDHSVGRSVQAELSGLIGERSETDHVVTKPSQEDLSRIGDLLRSKYGYVIEHVEDEKTYDTAAMIEAISAALEKIGAVDEGWRVDEAKDSSALAVSAHQKLVEVGENRAEIVGSDLKAKIFHEVLVHANRSVNAERAGWLSAAYGQEGYLDFEEALGTSLEQAFKGKASESGVNYYLIAGLAKGMDGHAPRDFRGVHEIMWRMLALKGKKSDADITEEAITKAKNSAYTACVRMFRGTPADRPGMIYSKDLSYFRGQEKVWSVLKDVHDEEAFDKLFMGKLDLTDEMHVKIAEDIHRTLQQVH